MGDGLSLLDACVYSIRLIQIDRDIVSIISPAEDPLRPPSPLHRGHEEGHAEEEEEEGDPVGL